MFILVDILEKKMLVRKKKFHFIRFECLLEINDILMFNFLFFGL